MTPFVVWCQSSDTVILREVEIVAVKNHGTELAENAAVTIISRTEAENLNIQSIKGLSDVVPNFFVPDYGSRITSSIYVRGIGARMDQAAVGLTIDNVPVLNKDAYDFDVPDIVRMEMLRGPQSTLFGRNTMCGLINITTLSPLSWQGLRFMTQYGNANSFKDAASFYWKNSQNLGLAVTLQSTGTDGFYSNAYNNSKVGKERQIAARFKTDWIASKTLHLINTLFISNLNQSGYPYRYADTDEINYNDTCFYRRFLLNDALTASVDINQLSLNSVTSFQLIHDNMTLDQDFLPLDYFTLTQKKHEWGITQDFVLQNKIKKQWNWLAGLFGFYKRNNMWAPVTFGDIGIQTLIENNRNNANPYYPIKWDSRSFILGSEFTIPTVGAAVYGQLEKHVSNFTLTFGMRFDYEHTSMNYHSFTNTGYTVYHQNEIFGHVPININQYGNLSRNFFELIPKVSIRYSINDADIYVICSKGYKAGGFNTQMFSDVLQQKLMTMMGIGASYDVDEIVGYQPEKSWNYETGININFFQNKLKTKLSIFLIDCRDQQLTMFPDGMTTGRIMTNAGRTHSAGGELSIVALPLNNLCLRAEWGYTHARFVKFNNGLADYKNKTLPYAPSNTLFLQTAYQLKINNKTSVDFDLHASGAGKIYWNESNTLCQPFYMQLGASLTLKYNDVSCQLWSENITDTTFDTFYFMSMKNAFLQKGRPLRFGITLRYNIDFNK